MKILLSNDDGVDAQGLAVLAKALDKLATVTVVAPDRNRSAASHSLTLDMPLRVNKQANGFYAVTGTPTDTVHIALTGWLAEHPDMVIAGINKGANLGDDLLYSGTMACAMEGRFLGYPAIAVSLVCEDDTFFHYESAATAVSYIIEKLQKSPLSPKTILNINVPNLPWEEIKGFQVTRLGYRHLAEKIIESVDGKGERVYWIGPPGKGQDAGSGTDFAAIENGYVSITPVKFDLTDHNALDNLSNWII